MEQHVIDLAAARVGDTFGPYRLTFDRERAGKFVEAVGGGESPGYGDVLPPTAIIAAGLAEIIGELSLFRREILDRGGVVHTSQEAEFLAPVKIGDEILATVRLTGNSVRRGSRFMVIFSEYRNAANEIVATASSTIVAPE